MKRNEAKQRDKERPQISNMANSDSKPVEVDDAMTKLLAGNCYDPQDIRKCAETLMEKYKHDYSQQFRLVEKLDTFDESLKDVTIKKDKPIFVVFAKTKNRWVLVCGICKDEGKTIILYKDPSGGLVDSNLENKLNQKFPGCEFLANSHNDQKEDDEKSYGPLTVRNLEILLDFLNTNTEMEKFEEVKFTNVEDLKVEKFQTAVTLTKELSGKEEFLAALKEFVDKLPIELGQSVMEYKKVLEEELEKEENKVDYARVKNARKQYLNEHHIEKLQQNYKTSHDEDIKEYQLDIEKKFPDEMTSLCRIFELFDDLKIDEALYTTLKKVSDILGIDYKKMKVLYESRCKVDDQPEKLTPEDISKIKPVPSNAKALSSDVTPLDQLLKEVVLGMDQDPSSEADLQKIKEKYNAVMKEYETYKTYEICEINRWAKSINGQLGTTDKEICKAIALMDRAYNLLTSYRFRNTQILSVLIFLHQNSQGRLCQIKTGEGKTVIVSLLATIKALQGNFVDVITSNPVLADDGVKETKTFYSVFGLTASTNNPDGVKIAYEADILYGTISNFQFDYLKDTFEGYNIRRERKFQQVILDEVDSMLIDNGGHIAKLAAPFPGMECLRYIYIKIWQELYKAEKSFAQEAQAKIKEILTSYQGDEAREKYSEFIKELISNERKQIKEKIKAADPTNIPLIPAHVKSYVNSKLDTWLKNALHAKYNCHEHQQYRIITDDSGEKVIAPVDYLNTGVTMKNTIWSNGLHQFVQLKHNVYLTYESLTSSFISNIGYIKNYEAQNICGLTGTLGSRAEQELLSSIYNINYAKIPTYIPKQFQEIPGIVVEDNSWSTEITLEILAMVDKQRAVLVILETEQDLLTLTNNLERLKFDNFRIRTFANEDNAKVTKEKVKIGDVILATNIAGRGTNFRTDVELEKNGGLHVCVGFLPCNLRVEEQAFGRTSRQGNKGTAQLIIRQSEVDELALEPNPNFDQIKEKRDLLERDRLKEIKNKLVKELNFKDELFKCFSRLYRYLKSLNNSESYSYVLQDLKECWAFWLEEKNFKADDIVKNARSPKEEFESFKNSEKCQRILKGTISHNPFYSIALSDFFLEAEDTNKASSALQHALQMGGEENKELLAGAHVKLFEVAIQSGDQLKERFKKAVAKLFFINVEKNDKYRQQAKKHLEAAKSAITKEIEYMCAFQESEDFAKILTNTDDNLFLKHVNSRRFCLEVHRSNIDNLLEMVNTVSGGVDIQRKAPTNMEKFKEMCDNPEYTKNLTGSEMLEMHSIGLDALFALHEVHDVSNTVIHGAHIQIGVGIAALCVGLAFLPIFPMMSGIAGTLISEGVIDIVMDILTQAGTEFSSKDYMKGKFVSYGISLLSFGISAVTQSVKILTKAASFCRKLSTFLRKSTYLKTLCEKLAKVVDKLATKLDDILVVAKFNKLNDFDKVDELVKLKKAGKMDVFEKLGGMKTLNKLNKTKNLSRVEKSFKLCSTFAVKTGTNIAKTLVENLVIQPLMDEFIKKLMEDLKNYFTSVLRKAITSNPVLMKKLQTTPEDKIPETLDNFMKIDEVLNTAVEVGRELLGVFENSKIDILATGVNMAKNFGQLERYSTCCASYLEKNLLDGKNDNKVDEIVENICSVLGEKMFDICCDCINDAKTGVKMGVSWAVKKIKKKYSKEDHKSDSTQKNSFDLDEAKLKKMALIIEKRVVLPVIQEILQQVIHKIKDSFKEELKKTIQNNMDVRNKLQSTPNHDINDTVAKFIEGNKALDIAQEAENQLFGFVKSDVTDMILAASNIIKDSIYFAEYFTKFSSFLTQNLKGGNCQNNVDAIIDEMCTNLADQVCTLLLQIGKNGFSLGKTAYRWTGKDIKNISAKNVVKNVFNKDNLKEFAKNMIEEQVFQPVIDELIERIKEHFQSYLEDAMKQNEGVVVKIKTTPIEKICSSIEVFINGNKVLKVAESASLSILDVYKHDAVTALKTSYKIIKNSINFDKYNNKVCSFLQEHLKGGDCDNDASEIIDEISSQLADLMFTALCEIFNSSKELVNLGKKNYKHLKTIKLDTASLKTFGKSVVPTVKAEFTTQVVKVLSELKNNEDVTKFLESKADSVLDHVKPILKDVVPFLQKKDIEKISFSGILSISTSVEQEMNKAYCYEVLELKLDASLDEIKRQFRKMVLQLTLLNLKDEEVEHKNKQLVKAYSQILNFYM